MPVFTSILFNSLVMKKYSMSKLPIPLPQLAKLKKAESGKKKKTVSFAGDFVPQTLNKNDNDAANKSRVNSVMKAMSRTSPMNHAPSPDDFESSVRHLSEITRSSLFPFCFLQISSLLTLNFTFAFLYRAMIPMKKLPRKCLWTSLLAQHHLQQERQIRSIWNITCSPDLTPPLLVRC